MQYQQAIDFLFSQFASYQRVGATAYKAGLETAHTLDNHLNNPHRSYPTIHVAGTNGKGSVSHMLTSALTSAGYRVGLYTSPHLKDFRERIRVNGEMIPEEDVVSFVESCKPILSKLKPSFFEITSAMAFHHFAQQGVDVAIIEVGLGGRLDSTNIITPALSVVTNIGMDHTAQLGNSLEAIAAEKAGIIKQGIPVVVSQLQPEVEHVLTTKAKEMNARIAFADQHYNVISQRINSHSKQEVEVLDLRTSTTTTYTLDLGGMYQAKNLLGVLESLNALRGIGYTISQKHTTDGLSRVKELTGLMGRWQIISNSPLTICDTGHNVDGIQQIIEQLRATPHNRLHMVIGLVNDKDVDGILGILPKDATYYFAKANIPRAVDASELMALASKFQLQGSPYPSVAQALNAAKEAALKDDMVFIGGSTFVVAEVV